MTKPSIPGLPDPESATSNVGPNIENEKSTGRISVVPSLVTYFGPTSVSVPAFLKAVKAAKLLSFLDADIQEAEKLMLMNDVDGSRLCALASQAQLPDAINRWIWSAVKQRIKAEIPEAFDASELDSAVIFRSLRERLSLIFESPDKGQRKRAEILLRLSLTWLITQRSLGLWPALEQLRPAFYRDTSASVRAVRRILTRGKIREIKEASSVAGLAQELVQTASRQQEQEQRRQINLQSQLTAVQSENSALRDRITVLEEEKISLGENLAATKIQIDESKQHWGHDMVEAKAQHNTLLKNRLVPLLNDAIDALEIDPAAPQIALKRLKTALSAIEEAAK